MGCVTSLWGSAGLCILASIDINGKISRILENGMWTLFILCESRQFTLLVRFQLLALRHHFNFTRILHMYIIIAIYLLGAIYSAYEAFQDWDKITDSEELKIIRATMGVVADVLAAVVGTILIVMWPLVLIYDVLTGNKTTE